MFSDPSHNLSQVGLVEGMYVADLGSGSGFYTLAAAKAVGGKGRVYSVDIQKDLLQKIKRGAEQEHLFNVEVVWGDIEKIGGTKLRDMCVDFAIISNILFQVEHKKDFAREVRRIVKVSGRALVIDWSDSFGGMGPAKEAVVPQNEAQKLFEAAGFVFERSIAAGDHHYGLLFRNVGV